MNPVWAADDLTVLVDGEAVTNHYYDDSVYGPFIALPYSRAARLVISGEALQAEFSTFFRYSLKLSTGGYHDIEWNYRDTFVNEVHEFSTFLDLDAESDFPVGLAEALDVDLIILHTDADRIESFIPKARGVDLEIEITNASTDDDSDIDRVIHTLMRFAEGTPVEFRRAWEAGRFTLQNVPDFRVKEVLKAFS
ncbi:hypothetical protein JXA80_04705 [bacterium]|nr:hypothetical protein [candidate division CSSED10-310 bacterium]